MRNGTTTQPVKTAAPLCATRRHIAHPHQILIETLPRIEFFVTPSFQRRKHFLIETRMRVSFFAQAAVRSADPVKINRHTKLAESCVSHSKQSTGPQINRHKFADLSARSNGFSSHSPLLFPVCFPRVTSHKSRITPFLPHSTGISCRSNPLKTKEKTFSALR